MSKVSLARLKNTSPYRRPLILAIALHVLLFVILFFHLTPSDIQQTPLQPDVDIIKAVAVSQDELTQLARAKAEQQRQAEQKLAEQRHQEAQKAEALRKQQELAKQQALAAQKQKEAQEAAAKLAAQKQKQAEEAAAKLAAQQAQEKAQAEKEAAAAAAQKAAAQKKTEAEKPIPPKTTPETPAHEKAVPGKPTPDKTQGDKTVAQSPKSAPQLKSIQQKDLQEKIAAEQRALAIARTQQQQSEIEKYKALIEQAISQNWEVPSGANPDLSCELLIRVGPGGAVINVQISRSSGDPALDDSARAAVFKASPLPVPADTDLFNQFRELRLAVTPEDVK